MSSIRNLSRCICNPLTKITLQTRNSSVSSSKKFKKLKLTQALMQCEDDQPVYLKKGTPDKILYGLTVILTFVGLFDSFRYIYRSAKK